MGRSSTARERLLDSAAELMHQRGYTGLGVAEICASADVHKGSFYHFFASKQALSVEVIDAHWACQRADWMAILGSEAPALQRVEGLFRAQVAGQRAAKQSSGMVNGCLLGNLALELSTQDPVISRRLEEVFDDQVALVEAVLAEAAADGEIPAASARRPTARALIAQLEGSLMFAKLTNDPGLLEDLWTNTLLLLRAPMVPPRDGPRHPRRNGNEDVPKPPVARPGRTTGGDPLS